MQSALEERGIPVVASSIDFIPDTTVSLDEEPATEVLRLVDAMEQDDDVQDVYHNLA